jgi:hypothetical protein
LLHLCDSILLLHKDAVCDSIDSVELSFYVWGLIMRCKSLLSLSLGLLICGGCWFSSPVMGARGYVAGGNPVKRELLQDLTHLDPAILRCPDLAGGSIVSGIDLRVFGLGRRIFVFPDPASLEAVFSGTDYGPGQETRVSRLNDLLSRSIHRSESALVVSGDRCFTATAFSPDKYKYKYDCGIFWADFFPEFSLSDSWPTDAGDLLRQIIYVRESVAKFAWQLVSEGLGDWSDGLHENFMDSTENWLPAPTGVPPFASGLIDAVKQLNVDFDPVGLPASGGNLLCTLIKICEFLDSASSAIRANFPSLSAQAVSSLPVIATPATHPVPAPLPPAPAVRPLQGGVRTKITRRPIANWGKGRNGTPGAKVSRSRGPVHDRG